MVEHYTSYDADLISVVIPMLNEADSLPDLIPAVFAGCEQTGMNCEIIAIDDGSTDNSLEVLGELRKADSRLKIIAFRRNFGKSDALDAGFRAARGRFVFTMDADLQDDPKEIPRFIEMMSEGWDLVSGWKKKRHDPLFSKNIPSRFFNRATSFFSGVSGLIGWIAKFAGICASENSEATRILAVPECRCC